VKFHYFAAMKEVKSSCDTINIDCGKKTGHIPVELTLPRYGCPLFEQLRSHPPNQEQPEKQLWAKTSFSQGNFV